MSSEPAELGSRPERGITRLEIVVSRMLRLGVLISSAVIVAGGAVTLVEPSTERAARGSVLGLRRGALHVAGLRSPHSIAGVFQGLGHGYGPAIVMLGLLLLIATPVLRVAVSVVGFAFERDRTFVLITFTVLLVLLGSFAVGM